MEKMFLVDGGSAEWYYAVADPEISKRGGT
jgi:hypothetical protein